MRRKSELNSYSIAHRCLLGLLDPDENRFFLGQSRIFASVLVFQFKEVHLV